MAISKIRAEHADIVTQYMALIMMRGVMAELETSGVQTDRVTYLKARLEHLNGLMIESQEKINILIQPVLDEINREMIFQTLKREGYVTKEIVDEMQLEERDALLKEIGKKNKLESVPDDELPDKKKFNSDIKKS